MKKEQTLLLAVEDMKHKLADAELRASDYKAQLVIAQKEVQELVFLRQVIDGSPELRALLEETIKKGEDVDYGVESDDSLL
ncbi:TPA: hypothetical protein TXJ06_002235 [Streptococcus suis]|nr:hypothetical protein [Streptococcus suis]HEL1585428.1 hypothetical protein [Streptococcus suis]